MSDTLTDMRNIRFMLYEVLDVEELTHYALYEDHSTETFEMALDTADQLAREVFWPTFQEFDREGAQFDGEKTTAPKAMHAIWKLCKEGGWFGPAASYDHGGQQFPKSVHVATSFLFNCANTSANMYVGSGGGAAYLIESVGPQELIDQYVPKLYGGEWSGTMALTEPDAGSSLGDITTKAVKVSEGDHYLIKGVKRFISSGDHDLAENIIHPVLARIEGAPPGVKGISLFLVPKYRLDDDSNPGEFNDVITAGIEHKLGIKGNATATLNFGEHDDCHGWLLGEENRGLAHMFLLVNSSRINTGVQAVAGASAAYQCALEYAHERLQGRDIAHKDPTTPPVPIINHPDVRLMLLRQKAFIEGAIGLIFYAAYCEDMRRVAEAEEDREHYHLLLEVLTPCIKAHGSDGAFESIRLAIQCFGGAGYCEEYPVAQMLRDSRVFSIYEGTNGIQALDLLGRKVPMKNGAAVQALASEIAKTIAEAEGIELLQDVTDKLQALQNELVATTMHLAGIGRGGDKHLYVANATAYLELFSQMLMVWQLLLQAVVAHKALDSGADEDFYKAKIQTARFYANQTVPHALATAQIIKSNERTALDFRPEWF